MSWVLHCAGAPMCRHLCRAGDCGRPSSRIYYRIYPEVDGMGTPSQKRALRNYRGRLAKQGMARFEVLGLDADRDLIRSLARRPARTDAEASRIRAEVRQKVSSGPPTT